MSKNLFLKIRNKLERDISNSVKKSTGNDLFDWTNLGILFGGGSFLISLFVKNEILDLQQAIPALILWFTAFVLIRYTKETYYLKKLAQKQNITSIRPYLRLQKKAGENKLQLVNEGKGVAVNLRAVYKKEDKEIKLPGITAMAAAPNSVTEGLTPARLGIDFEVSTNFSITINYEDIEGRGYVATFNSNDDYNDKFEIVNQSEV